MISSYIFIYYNDVNCFKILSLEKLCYRLLTAKNITHQLLYRYYKEIEKCQRSALKKILEKDESPTKRIILCVSKIVKVNVITHKWICLNIYLFFQ